MIYEVNNRLRCSMLYDGTAETRLSDILIAMERRTFGKNEAASIVGGRGRLVQLMDEGKIRIDKPTNKQNGKWFCNAADVLRYAVVKVRQPRKTKKHEKDSNKRSVA